MKGKETCNLRFIEAFLAASEKVKETGKPVSIEGFSGWKVSPVKKEDFE